MRASVIVLGALLTLAPAGCGDGGQPGPPVPLKFIVLHDVQGFFGGHALWVAEDNTAVVQVVGPVPPGKTGLWEKRYKTKLTAEQRAEVERLVGALDFLRLKIRERKAVPDEAHPRIMVVTKNGDTVRLRKWANDKNPRFDPLYGCLLDICREAEKAELTSEGVYDWDWRPAGFDSSYGK